MKFRTLQGALTDSFSRANKDKIAINYGDKCYTYQEVEKATNMLVDRLYALGARKGDKIAVLSENRSIVIFSSISILKLGGIFVPLDPSYTAIRLRELSEMVNIDYVVTEDLLYFEFEKVWREVGVKTLQISEEIIASNSNYIPSEVWITEYNYNDPIYIYFTSGTTGKPKAVVGKNVSLLHFILWEIDTFRLDENIIVSQLTSPVHDPYLRDVYTTLIAGGTICIPADKHLILSPFDFVRWVNESKVNLIHCTPTMFQNLSNGSYNKDDFPELRWILIAGEQLTGTMLKKWYGILGHRIQLYNLYGPTETTLAKLYYQISPDDITKTNIPIGKPIDNTSIRIINDGMQEVGGGETGELYINTEFPTLGYYENNSINQDIFITETIDGGLQSFYKTGDFVKLLKDQNIEFIGRRDRQVKLMGRRIELSEIENKILNYPNIGSCVVHLFKDNDLGSADFLAAYYILQKDIEEKQLRSYLKERLPDYMIPNYFIKIDSFPMNTSGKIEYSLLPNPLELKNSNKCTVENNRQDEDIDQVRNIWKEILEIDEINDNDVFMQIGGDSRSMMLLIARIHTEFDFELSLWDIFDDLTIIKLNDLIKANKS